MVHRVRGNVVTLMTLPVSGLELPNRGTRETGEKMRLTVASSRISFAVYSNCKLLAVTWSNSLDWSRSSINCLSPSTIMAVYGKFGAGFGLEHFASNSIKILS